MSHLFAVTDSTLHTPKLDLCGVAGIMRSAVIDAARSNGITVVERALQLGFFQSADEVFLCNSIFGIWPVCVLDDIAFSVGALTQSLMQQLEIYPR
jgi:4-amino-4-deoxychorismate lyase